MTVLLSAICVAAVLALLMSWRNGRFSRAAPLKPTLDAPYAEYVRGDRATLLQFSSAFCAPCRVTRRVLTEVSDAVPGVEHVEIDAEQHLDLVRRFNIVRTPTTIILDSRGFEVTRASGAPTKPQVLQALDSAVE